MGWGPGKIRHEIYNEIEDGDLHKDERNVDDCLSNRIGCRAVERTLHQSATVVLHKFRSTYKLLCLSKIGLLENAAVNSARASRALNSSMKNITPPRAKTAEEF